MFPVRRKRTPSSPLRPAPVPTLSNEQCAPEVHRAGRCAGPAEPRPGTREAGPRRIAEPAGGRRPGRGSPRRAPRKRAPAGSRSPRYEPPRPPRRPVLRRPYPAGRRNQGARGEPPRSGGSAPRGPYPGTGRLCFQGPQRLPRAREAEGRQRPEGPPPRNSAGRGGERNPLEPRANPGGHRGQTGARPDEGQSGPGRTGDPPRANRPRLARGGNGGAGEQVPRAPGPARAPWLARAVTNDADNAAPARRRR